MSRAFVREEDFEQPDALPGPTLAAGPNDVAAASNEAVGRPEAA